MDGIDHSDVPSPDVLQHGTNRACGGRRDEKMHVVRHQYIRVHGAVARGRCSAQAFEIKAPIHVVEKTGCPIVAALNDMQRDAGKL
jgi:hypothetical protein